MADDKILGIPDSNKETDVQLVCDSSTKSHIQQLVIIIFLAFGTFCNGAVSSLQGPFFPKEAELKGATPAEYGLIQGSMYIVMFLAAPAFGKILSRFGQAKFFIIFGAITTGVCVIAFGMLSYVAKKELFIALCYLCRILEGIGSSIYRTCNTAIGTMLCANRAATIYSILRTASGVGLMIGPLIGGTLFDIGGYKLPFLVVGLLFLVDAIGLFFVLPTCETQEKNGERNSGALKFWFNPGTLLYFTITFFCFVTYGFYTVSLEPHLRQFDLSGTMLGVVFSVKGIIYGTTALIVGWTIDKTNRYSIFVLTSITSIIFSLILVGPMPFLQIHRQLWIVVLALALYGFGSSTNQISTFTGLMEHSISRNFAKNLETYGFVSSLGVSSTALGCFVGPSVGGYMLEKLGFDTSALVLICIETILLLFTVFFLLLKAFFQQKQSKKIEFQLGTEEMQSLHISEANDPVVIHKHTESKETMAVST